MREELALELNSNEAYQEFAGIAAEAAEQSESRYQSFQYVRQAASDATSALARGLKEPLDLVGILTGFGEIRDELATQHQYHGVADELNAAYSSLEASLVKVANESKITYNNRVARHIPNVGLSKPSLDATETDVTYLLADEISVALTQGAEAISTIPEDYNPPQISGYKDAS